MSTYSVHYTYWQTGDTQIKVGDEVIVYGRSDIHNGSYEAPSQTANLYSLNGKVLPVFEYPDPFYVCGTYCKNDWEKAMPTVPVYGNPRTQWRIVWVDENGIKVSPTKSEANYTEYMFTPVYTTTAGFTVTPDGKIIANTPGWYLMIIDATINHDKRELTLNFRFDEASVWLIGTSIVNADAGIVNGSYTDNPEYVGCWDESGLRSSKEQYVKFTAPTEMNGEFVSPALTSPVSGDGGTRAYVKVKTMEWWKSEFIVLNGKIVYRGNGGEQEHVDGFVGQRLYLNFLNDTGEVR